MKLIAVWSCMMSRMALLPLILLSGCVTQPAGSLAKPVNPTRITAPSDMRKSGPGKVALTIARDAGAFGSACPARVYVNGREVADLYQAENVTVYEPAGYTILGIGSSGLCAMAQKSEISSTTTVGRDWKYRVYIPAEGNFVISPTAF